MFTDANIRYWTTEETMRGGACGVMKAAFDFRGTAWAVDTVRQAFAAVDIACDKNHWTDP